MIDCARRMAAAAILVSVASHASAGDALTSAGDALQVALPLAAAACATHQHRLLDYATGFLAQAAVTQAFKHGLGNAPINERPDGTSQGFPPGTPPQRRPAPPTSRCIARRATAPWRSAARRRSRSSPLPGSPRTSTPCSRSSPAPRSGRCRPASMSTSPPEAASASPTPFLSERFPRDLNEACHSVNGFLNND